MTGIMLLLNVFSIIFFAFSIIFVMLCKRWGKNQLIRMEAKKREIEGILDSADQMIEELNNFSDYMINNIQEKTAAVDKMINSLDERIKADKEYVEQAEQSSENNLGEPCKDTYYSEQNLVIPIQSRSNITSSIKHQKPKYSANESKYYTETQGNITSKSMQIILLSESGLSEPEIARKLNVGRGEIQLVLGMRKGIMQA